MTTRTLAYWTTTALTAFIFLSGGPVDILRPDFAAQGMTHLGYPPYFMVILGIWKTLGGIAVLLPRTPRLKEWAYAGMLFDLTGASASHAATGDPFLKTLTPLLLLLLVLTSYVLRPASRKIRPTVRPPHHSHTPLPQRAATA